MKVKRTEKQALALFASGLQELPDADLERLAQYYAAQAAQRDVVELPDAQTGELCGFRLSDLLTLTERERLRRSGERKDTE